MPVASTYMHAFPAQLYSCVNDWGSEYQAVHSCLTFRVAFLFVYTCVLCVYILFEQYITF